MSNRFALGFLGLALATALQPASAASRPAACSATDSPAQLMRAINPVRPSIAIAQNATGKAIVEVKLSTSGSVVATRIVESTGNKWLDREALDTARRSTFVPAVQQCTATGGSYRVTIEFSE
jgi:TonB family protein